MLLFDDSVRDELRTWAEETGSGIVAPVTGTPQDGLEVFVVITLHRDDG